MARTLEARLASLKAQIGWRMTVLTDKRGRELMIPTVDLLDAWLAWRLQGKEPATLLSRRASVFLAGARLRGYEGDMLLGLRDACRDYWHKQKEVKK